MTAAKGDGGKVRGSGKKAKWEMMDALSFACASVAETRVRARIVLEAYHLLFVILYFLSMIVRARGRAPLRATTACAASK